MPETLFLVLLVVHVLAATTWVGGLIFFMVAVIPATRRAPDAGIPFLLGRAFRPAAWVALVTLLVTGPALLLLQGMGPALVKAAFWNSPFGLTLALKLTLIVAVLTLTLWHDIVLGPRAEAGIDTQAPRRVGRAIGLLSLAILCAGILLSQGL